MKCLISRLLLESLGAAAGRSGEEICGLLLGGLLGDWAEIEAALPLPNAAPDPTKSFVLEPRAHVRASRLLRAQGRRIIGHYHSHPRGCPMPSAADARAAGEPHVYWLILTGRSHGLWTSRRNGSIAGAFERVSLDVVEGPALQPGREGAIGIEAGARQGRLAHEIL